jgi:hypothetical protein
MGHKGVSKRKPKQSKPFSKTAIGGFANGPPVQSLVKDKAALLNRGGENPSAGSNQKHKKGN